MIVCLLFCVFGFPSCFHSDRGSTVCQSRDADFPFRSWHFFQHVHCSPSDWEQPVRVVQPNHLANHSVVIARTWYSWASMGVFAEAIHTIRLLVCVSTNETPHERLFRFPTRSMKMVWRCLHPKPYFPWILCRKITQFSYVDITPSYSERNFTAKIKFQEVVVVYRIQVVFYIACMPQTPTCRPNLFLVVCCFCLVSANITTATDRGGTKTTATYFKT